MCIFFYACVMWPLVSLGAFSGSLYHESRLSSRSLYLSNRGLLRKFRSDVYSLFLRTQNSEGKFQSNVFSRCNDNAILFSSYYQVYKAILGRPDSGCKCYLKLALRHLYDKLFITCIGSSISLQAWLLFVRYYLFLTIFGWGKPTTPPLI